MLRIARKDLPPAGIFHVRTRGAGRMAVYVDDHDHHFFDGEMHEALDAFGLRLHAWCQLRNHYRLLAEGRRDALSRAMHRLNFRHAQRFNERWGRWGHVWGDRFALWVIRDDEHYEKTIPYMLANPVRVGICSTPDEWQWSGPRYLLGSAEPPQQRERPLVPRDAVRPADRAEPATVLHVPVVGGAQRLAVREPWLPPE